MQEIQLRPELHAFFSIMISIDIQILGICKPNQKINCIPDAGGPPPGGQVSHVCGNIIVYGKSDSLHSGQAGGRSRTILPVNNFCNHSNKIKPCQMQNLL